MVVVDFGLASFFFDFGQFRLRLKSNWPKSSILADLMPDTTATPPHHTFSRVVLEFIGQRGTWSGWLGKIAITRQNSMLHFVHSCEVHALTSDFSPHVCQCFNWFEHFLVRQNVKFEPHVTYPTTNPNDLLQRHPHS